MTEITTVEEREALAGILYPYVNVLRGEDWEQALEVADAALRWFAARQPAPTVSAMSDAVEPLDLDAVRERWGEWYGRDGYVGTPARWDDIDDGESPDHYIVRQDVPALLAEVERLRVALTTARRDALTEAADSVDDAGRYWFGTNDRQRLRARAAQEEGR